MKTLKFKTNIKCDGCIAKVTPHLNAVQGIDHWKVDLTSPDKVLEVETENVKAEEVSEALGKAGYKGETI
ncbi:cation transporter [Cytophagaceae bacterium DM2B3-1]|uniref:Cation transporter n=1 Tax=Xanthocytophaga flava TaxID=3048013 RepID=A0ABT7CEW8_9BACT|nr:cation transporter [Xanthocytophaga flavus]MDJ1472239.1 cation transporter [Xanthocytophaga flavus]MDJ1492250.1 cation transporter [Xanthocytophaga flavus]